MRQFAFSAIVMGVLALMPMGAASAQDFAFEMVQPEEAGGTSVAGNAVTANVSSWPATLVFRFQLGGGSYACTSTVIGPRTVLTAAHCVADGSVGKIKIGGTSYVVSCKVHGQYSPGAGKTYDIALCSSDETIALKAGSKRYESINVDAGQIVKKKAITLLGYGCVERIGDNPGLILYEGQTEIDRISGIDIVTTKNATVCPGDSGGGAYIVDSSTKRRVAAINSRVGLDANGAMNTTSRLTDLTHSSIAKFIKDWVKDNEAEVCGYNLSGSSCRP